MIKIHIKKRGCFNNSKFFIKLIFISKILNSYKIYILLNIINYINSNNLSTYNV
jgi:hypothetical protein